MSQEDELATILRGLAYLLRSGIDPDRALGMVAGDSSPGMVRALESCRRRLRAGRSLPGSLRAADLIADHELPRLEALTEIGAPEHALNAFAAERVRRRQLRRQIGQGLVLPGAILLVAFVVTPLPAVARGDLSLAGYLFGLVVRLGIVAFLVAATFRWAETAVRCARELSREALGRPTLVERQRLCRELGNLLGSGLDAERALASLARSSQGALARRFERARRAVASKGVVPALVGAGLVDGERDRAPLLAAEESGRLAGGLEHQADLLGDDVDRRYAMVAEWLPRLAYFGVIAWLLGGFLTGGAGMVMGA